jgi:hypothetical protein
VDELKRKRPGIVVRGDGFRKKQRGLTEAASPSVAHVAEQTRTADNYEVIRAEVLSAIDEDQIRPHDLRDAL